MKFRIVNSLPDEDWIRFVDQHPDGNVFHTPDMFRVYQQVKGYNPELWAALGEHDQILVLFLPVHISLNSGIIKPLTTRTNVFGGVLVKTGETEAFSELITEYKKRSGKKSQFTEIRNQSSVDHLQSTFSKLDFRYEEQLNYLIDLTPSPEEVFNRIGQRTRRNIRHGLNQSKVQILQVSDLEGVLESYELLSKTYHHAQVPLSDRSLFEVAFEQLSPKGMMMVNNAYIGNSPAATSIELIYKDTITGWFAGMDRRFSKFNANELLMWHLLTFGANNGFRVYDFGGAGRSDKKYGVRDFKAKFGGALVSFGRNIWVPNPILFAISKLAYSAYRKLYSLGNS